MSALLALFVRALRQDARNKMTYWGRAGLVMGMLVLLALTQSSSGWAGAPGLRFFSSSIFINFFFISLAGLSYFASAITEEKEEMTLGLLRMTNLNPLSILLGKSTSRLCGALLLLAVQFPFTFLAVSFGGVSVPQIIAAYCTLAAYILMLSSLALLFSVLARRTAGAAFLTGTILFVYLVGYALLPACLKLLEWMRVIPSAVPGAKLAAFLTAWARSSPFDRLSEILRTGFHEGPIGTQVVSNITAGGILFLIAWALFDTFNSEQRDSAPARGPIARGGSRLRFASAGRAWHRALVWKDFHFLAGGRVASLLRFVLYGLLLAIVLWSPLWGRQRPIKWSEAGFTIMGIMAVTLSIELAFAAGRIFRQEWRWKTLSGLAMLPIPIRSIAYQKILAALLSLWPGILYFAFGFVCTSRVIWDEFVRTWSAPRTIESALLGGLGLTVVTTLFFLHLVANLSLRVKWGAIPLAFAITYLGPMFLFPITMFFFRNSGGLFVHAIMFFIATVALHVNTGVRLRRLAAEE
jgi:hypothetical protein